MINPCDVIVLELVPPSLIFECGVLPYRNDVESLALFCPDVPGFAAHLEERLEFILDRKIEWIPVEGDLLQQAIYDRFPLASADIRYCLPQFEFECPKTWEALQKTHDPRVRHCPQCRREVTWTADYREAKLLGSQGKCIAFSDVRESETLGMVDTGGWHEYPD